MPVFRAISTSVVRAYQKGGLDANGQPPERQISDGGGNPCRHCLTMIPKGAGMLVLAHRPFSGLHPYAEVGPIFLCADPCEAGGGGELPEILDSPAYLVRGYGADERIVYGSGAVVPRGEILQRSRALLADQKIAFVHIRSASNNCYHLRVEA